ncbi:hypothetical protein ACFLT1_05860 [Bacteroidota bacterium]
MKIRRSFTILLLSMVLLSSIPSTSSDYRSARENNVCKSLKNDVLLYFAFIDTRTTYPWTEFDILTTIDSIYVAEKWLEDQAEQAGITLNIKTDYYIGNEFTTINRNLPKNDVRESLNEPNVKKGIESINRWGDYIAKTIGESLYIREKDGIPQTKKPSTKERLIAHFRDDYRVESVALMFLVNNYYRDDISICLNTMNSDDVEFAVVSYKYPAEIAHYFLKLFGGLDLYKSSERRSNSKAKLAKRLFPEDIMQNPEGKNLRDLNIGDFTKYMIGWTDELKPEYEALLSDGIF